MFPFVASKGLKQECCVSPTLSKIYLHFTAREWMTRWVQKGVLIDEGTFYFPDDQVKRKGTQVAKRYSGCTTTGAFYTFSWLSEEKSPQI